jgi:hypothetical protein
LHSETIVGFQGKTVIPVEGIIDLIANASIPKYPSERRLITRVLCHRIEKVPSFAAAQFRSDEEIGSNPSLQDEMQIPCTYYVPGTQGQ